MHNLIKGFAAIGSYEAKRIQDLEVLIRDLEYLSGYRLETLKDMFAAGWTLTPPKNYKTNLSEMLEEWKRALKEGE